MATQEPLSSFEEEEQTYEAWSDAFSDSEDDGNLEEIFDTNDLVDIGQSKVEHLGLMTTYAPKWTPQEGFREIYQNW